MNIRKLLPALLFLAAAPTALFAQAIHTYVSGVGDDQNPGSRTAPCKTFAGVLGLTTPKGLISVLDPGGFGSVTINQSVTIDGGGIDASVNVSGTNGITVNAAATDVVILRHLNIQGLGTSPIGIRIVNAAAIYVEDCKITGFDKGISFESPVAGAQLFVDSTRIEECRSEGVLLTAGGATVRNSAASGILTTPGATPVGNGFHAGAGTQMTLDSCTASGNNYGIFAEGTVYLANSTVADNAISGVAHATGGKVISVHNNRFMGNTTDGKILKAIPQK